MDDQSDMKNTMTLQRKLSGLVEVCVLDDSYHLVTLDRQRSYVADRSIEFVERVMAQVISRKAAAEKASQAAAQKPLKGAAE
jgi:carboxylesterase